MAAASSQSVDLDEQRAELRSVLDSAHFLRAPKLAQLLSYLCEKLFSGDAAHIKEYSVGLEVFGRGDSFDQNTDSIVRVEANRLRKRLAEFYSGEGAAHRLRITIPVGQYIPEFERVQPSASQPEPDTAPGPGSPLAVKKDAAPAPALGRPEVPAGMPSRTPAPPLGLLIPSALLFLAVAALALYYTRTPSRDGPGSPAPSGANPTPAPLADSPFGPPPGDEVRILSGAARSFVDHAGKLWSADTWVTGGTPVKGPAQHIWRTLEPEFYRNSRQGQFRYDIPLRQGVYELRLHFAETTFGPESAGAGGEGSRIMSVRANGSTLLSAFDIAADAGASRTADVKVFPNIEPASDGKLHLEFAGEDGRQAALSAIEITPGLRGQLKPLRILARQSPYYSNDSQWWSPDTYFEGGQIAAYPTPVNGTDDPELYQTERWGNFSYAIPVPPGKYSVWLHFAARHPEPAEGGHEIHVFNVFCNGRALLEKFDLPDAARQADIVVRKFSGLEPNAQGKLLLSFVPVEGYASVTGIEVMPQ
jgi:hypothetical protein